MNEDTGINFDTLIVGQIEIKEKWQKELSEIEKRKALSKSLVTDRVAAAEAKQKIKDAEDAIADLNKQRRELQESTKIEEQASTLAEEKVIIDALIKDNNIGYLVKENKYAYCMGMQENNSTVVNPVFEFVDANKFGRVLNKMAGKQLRFGSRVLADELADHFQRLHKDYYMTTCSFNKEKWGRSKVYNKADIISRFWVTPDFDNACNYDRRFDFLLRCIGGGKKENIDHLEKWVTFKYLFPDRVGNTPNLDIGGYPGGNGKGRFVELCKTIFTNPCVSAATLDELTKFNSNWEMSLLLYYDEPEQNELPEGKLKNATGSEDIRIEKKGIDATMADRNYSLVFLSNNPNGVVKLAGTGSSGEDRRYSVMVTNLVMVDEAEKLGLTLSQAKDYVNEINNMIKNRTEVAKWLAHIIMKHNVADIGVLPPLHGQDYKDRFEDQKSPMDVAFDQLVEVFKKNGVLPYEVLLQCVLTVTGWEKLGAKKLKMEWKRYVEKNRLVMTDNKISLDYTYDNKGTIGVQKQCYQLTDNPGHVFDFKTILRKQPFDMKKAAESCEHRDLLLLCES